MVGSRYIFVKWICTMNNAPHTHILISRFYWKKKVVMSCEKDGQENYIFKIAKVIPLFQVSTKNKILALVLVFILEILLNCMLTNYWLYVIIVV